MMTSDKPHAVCIPVPLLSHVMAMLNVAKLLHQRGFFITFVITDYVHKRIIKSRGPNSLDAILNFQFKTIADGIMPEDADIEAPQDLASICIAISNHFLAPFSCLLSQLNHEPTPPVSCIVSDGCMSSFTIKAAMEFNVPIAHLWTVSPCSLLGYMHFDELVKRGVTPFKGISYNLASAITLYALDQDLESAYLMTSIIPVTWSRYLLLASNSEYCPHRQV